MFSAFSTLEIFFSFPSALELLADVVPLKLFMDVPCVQLQAPFVGSSMTAPELFAKILLGLGVNRHCVQSQVMCSRSLIGTLFTLMLFLRQISGHC